MCSAIYCVAGKCSSSSIITLVHGCSYKWLVSWTCGLVYLFIGGVRTRRIEAPCNLGLVFIVLALIAISYDHITLSRHCCGQGSRQCKTVKVSLILKLVIFILESGWIFITLVIVWHWRWKNLLSRPPGLFFWDLNSAQWPFDSGQKKFLKERYIKWFPLMILDVCIHAHSPA